MVLPGVGLGNRGETRAIAFSLGSLYLFNPPTKELLIQQILGGLHSPMEGSVDPPEESVDASSFVLGKCFNS